MTWQTDKDRVENEGPFDRSSSRPDHILMLEVGGHTRSTAEVLLTSSLSVP